MFAGAHEVFHIVTSSNIPFGTKALAGLGIEKFRKIRFRLNGKIGVAEYVGPFIVVIVD